jgi:pimeloyl-ACP methyl ester carboxylesterase
MQAQFKHLTIDQPSTSKRLHVYIEGDGIPFRNRFQISQDPSPRYPLMIKLMSLDSGSSFYLGRPCYFNTSLPAMLDDECHAKFWTSARYSNDVVASMTQVLRQQLAAHPSQGVTLIGHSGGGTLAMLIAARMPEVDQVVTLAGNLDTQAWLKLHHYSSLPYSLNPADTITSAQPAKQLHFGGDKDDNIPPYLSKDFLTRIGQSIQVIPDADHGCCWVAHWGELLGQINQQMSH